MNLKRTNFYRAVLLAESTILCFNLFAQDPNPSITEVWEPEPAIVNPGTLPFNPPSDALVLFDGTSGDKWQNLSGEPFNWKIENGVMTVVPFNGDIITKDKFGDCQLHIEWRTPEVVTGKGQGRGNSGIYFMSLYEVQVLDSYQNRTYSNGQAASIYKQHMPLVNASKPPGEWQYYDIIFIAPIFNENGQLKSQARVTVIHNGVLVQNNVSLLGSTQYIGIPKNTKHGSREPLLLQDHHNTVSYRNIWIRNL